MFFMTASTTETAGERVQGVPLAEFRDVSLRYDGSSESTLALEHLDLDVHPGELLAVVGMSGCGKSSLLKLISGLVLPTSGSVKIHGKSVTRPLGIVGMAFQKASLLPWRTTLQNLLLPTEVGSARRNGTRNGEAVARARDLLATVGLTEAENKLPKELSGGMQQRVSLCRAVIHQPELLLLDEPFGALDAFTREELWGVLQRLREETGCTVVLITHDLTEAVFLADRVAVMSPRPGRIVYEAAVPFARPRHLDQRYQTDFTAITADLRHHISQPQEVLS